MLSRDIPLFKLDLSGKNPDNFISSEYYRRTDTQSDIVFVMRAGPFYTSSLVLTTPEGDELVEDDDYEIYGIASALTAFAKDKEVGMMIKMLNSKISEWFASYQVMGHFSILNQDLVNLIESAMNDDRPLYYRNIKNTPTHFDPKLHQHDIRYDIHSFSDLINIIQRIPEIKKQRKDTTLFSVEHFYDTLTSHIEAYESMLLEYISKHDSDNADPLTNSHGLTAKQVGLENVDNFETASLLDTLDGFRQDMHLTVDNVQKVMKQQQDASKTLYPYGILPILRYGNNSFIPSPIQGSYEGMGGTDFRVGFNYEPSGEVLMLGNRNDGRVNALYFMRNEDLGGGSEKDKWVYTAYAYSHQTAINEGVSLNKIIRGSDGRFLILGGTDKSNKTVWYYALGNGSFNPLKHVLIRIPDTVNVTVSSLLFNEGFPDRVLLFTRQESASALLTTEYRNVVFETPTDANSFSGVGFNNATIGYWGYEYSITNKKWRKINFNYNQCGRTEQISSRLWAPFKFVIEATSTERPRADGRTDLPYGLSASQYYFTSMISFWNLRGWFECMLGFYKESNDSFYIKMLNAAYGQDSRSATHEGGNISMNFVMGRRSVDADDEIVQYTLENRRGLDTLYRYNATVLNSGGKTSTDANVTDDEGNKVVSPNGDGAVIGYNGDLTLALLNGNKYIGVGSTGHGTFPITIGLIDLTSSALIADPDTWLSEKINSDTAAWGKRKTLNYNETNPINLSIGMFSVFWQQLDPDDPKSMGSISYGFNGSFSRMLYRRQPTALNANGYPVPPEKDFTLYVDKQVKGYELDNKVEYILNTDKATAYTAWCTNVFLETADNRKKDYVKHFAGHQSVGPLGGNVNNNNARTQFHIEWEFQEGSETITYGDPKETVTLTGYVPVPTKTIEMKEVINDVLIPTIIDGANTIDSNYTFINAMAWHRITFTHLRSTKYENLLIFATVGYHKTLALTKIFSVAFNLTGGTPDSDGIIQGATATPVGNVVMTDYTVPLSGEMENGRKENATFVVGSGNGQVQPRDVIRQLENGNSLVNMQWNIKVDVTANLNKPGVSYIVSENGIETTAFHYTYWTTSGYAFFHHPYYGMVARAIAPGAVQIGRPYTRTPTTASEIKATNSSDPLIMGDSNYMEGAFTVIFAVAQSGLQNGNKFNLSTGQQDLSEIVSDPRNKTFYIYLDYNENGAYYNISLAPQAETASRGLLSIVKTNNDSIYEIVNYNVFTMNGVRVSIEKKGSVIPAASGSIYEAGQLEGWVTNNRS